MGKAFSFISRRKVYFILLAGLLLAGPTVSLADDTVCARVKIEIKQELTLERQAFDAHLRINNGLANISLENVKVEVAFTDEDSNPVPASSDPDPSDALFFIRLDSKDNISDVGGTGTVGPSSSADIHWLIIPAPGASNGLEKGTLYYVGAKFSYTIGGEEKVTEVTPDYILVKPMPEITLDYFLPTDVYGDDPFTSEIEPIVPFSLGVRVRNSGYGVAAKLKIDSAQPQITENKQGLLIGFTIAGSEVNGKPATDSLLVDFGDILPNRSGLARWIMTCSLAGKFVSFTAGFSHSDEVGGELTSLVKAANSHFLVQDVLVDLPGRDAVRDFLAKDGDVYRIYESEFSGIGDPEDGDLEVADQSHAAILTGSGNMRTLTTGVTAGFIYIQLTDPFGGQKVLKEVIRSDGKIIKSDNIWLSHTREKNDPWKYFLNLFDVNSPGIYTIKFEDESAVPVPPVMQDIVNKTVAEDEQISFIVETSDPNGTVPKLSAAPLPTGADFIDQGQGLGLFDWTPIAGQAGVYEIVFSASDGALEARRRATITVKGFRDTDGDDLNDDWERQHFGTLDRDGNGDFDHDGISDRDEFFNDTDPATLADLVIHQTADNLYPSVGDLLTLTITAINNGPRDAAGVQVLDLLASGLSYISDNSGGSYDSTTGIWHIGDLSAAAEDNTQLLIMTVEVIGPGKILNIATLANADLYDPDRSNNSAGLVLNGGIQSDLALSQIIDNPMPGVGDTVVVNLKVTNNGVDDATGVLILDGLPAALIYQQSIASQGDYDPDTGIWDVGDLAVGAGAMLQLTLTANNIDEIINTAGLYRSDQLDPDFTNNRSSVVINQDLVKHPYLTDLAVYKLVSQSAVDVGEQVAFTLLVRNNGPDDAGNIEIDDLLPDGLDLQAAAPSHGSYDDEAEIWQVASIPAGSYVLMDTTVGVMAGDAQENQATIVGFEEFDPDGVNDSDAKRVTGMAADITVTQSVDRSTANIGEDFVFTITVTNQGPHSAFGIMVVDEVPPGLIYQSNEASQGIFDPLTGQWDIGDLAVGKSVNLKITLLVDAAGEMINRVILQSSNPTDTDDDNNSHQVILIGNAPPDIGEIPDLRIEEGTSFTTIDLNHYVADDNNGADEITWSFSSDGPLSVRIDEDRMALIEVPHIDWNGSDTITFTATDPFGMSDEEEILFTVTAVNDGPVNVVAGDRITHEDTGLAISPAIFTSDIDANSGALTVMLTATHGTLTLATTADLMFTAGDGTEDAALSFSGTLAAINNALDGMRFDPDADYFGSALLEIQTNDQGHTGAGGSLLDVDTVNIDILTVNDSPLTEIAAAFSGTEGQPIKFSCSASDIDSEELTYSWDFDYSGNFAADADSIDLTAPQWAYQDNGTFMVALRVEDEDGGISEIVTGVVNVDNVAPTVVVGADQTVEEGAFFSVEGSFFDPGADTHEIQWDFGDGSTASGTLSPIHAYADNGVYTVALTITDDDGGQGVDILTVTVNNAPPLVNAGADLTAREGAAVSFSGSFSDSSAVDTHEIYWDFGDGTVSNAGSLTPTHVYGENRLYTVLLTVIDDDGGMATDTLTVTVDNVVPEVKAGDDQNSIEGREVVFSAAFSDPGADTHTMTWDFGDNATASGTLTPVHSYGDNGTYTVTLTVTDDDGGAGTDTLKITVANAVPILTGMTTDSPSPGKIHLSAPFVDPGWLDHHTGFCEFGDGTTGTVDVSEENEYPDSAGTVTVTHNYAMEGLHMIKVRVADDDGASSAEQALAVLIDKTQPVINISEPAAGYYYNTQDLTIDFAVEDPVSHGVASGIVEKSVVATLDDAVIADGQFIDLAVLEDGEHAFKVAASDHAGNRFEQEVSFEVRRVPVWTHIEPHKWNLDWLDPFENIGDKKLKNTITALISFENVAVETILPTFDAAVLELGRGYGNFVIQNVIAVPVGTPIEFAKVRSLSLKYVGNDKIDVLAFSGSAIWDFYDLNPGAIFTIDAGAEGHLSRYTTLSSYKSGPPLYSSVDIIPDTIRLNDEVPIIAGSAKLIAQDPSALDQSQVIVEAPYAAVAEKRHHVWLTNLGQPQQISLEVGNQTIFEEEPYPINWYDRFSLVEDGQLQMLRIHVSGPDNVLRVFHHNLQAEARIYLDGVLALTILPEVKLVVMRVEFNPFEVISTVSREALERGGEWMVTTYNGTQVKEMLPRKHITVSDIGDPQTVKLVVGDTIVFDDEPFPIKWSDHYFLVDGERQDLSIDTFAHHRKSPYLSIHCKQLTHEAKLYLNNELVLLILPPREAEMVITGDLELDGNLQTFDGSFRGTDEIELEGKLPTDYDLDKTYQRINTAGEPALEIGDRFVDFEVYNFTEGYDEYRIAALNFIYEGLNEAEIKVYEDSSRNFVVDSYRASWGHHFSLDVSHLEVDQVYLEIGDTLDEIPLTGTKTAEVGDSFLDCTVFESFKVPLGPPHYIDLALKYVGSRGPISVKAYNGRWKEVIDTYEVNHDVDPVIKVDGSGLSKGYIGENLVLEYGQVVLSE